MIQRIDLKTILESEGYKYVDGEIHWIYGGVKIMNKNKFYKYLSFPIRSFIESKDINFAKIDVESVSLHETEDDAYSSEQKADSIDFLTKRKQIELCKEIKKNFIEDIKLPMRKDIAMQRFKKMLVNKSVYNFHTYCHERDIIKSLYGEYVSISTPIKSDEVYESEYKCRIFSSGFGDMYMKNISLETSFSPLVGRNLLHMGMERYDDLMSGLYTYYIGLDEEYIKKSSNLEADISYSLKYDNSKGASVLNIQFKFKDEYTEICMYTLLKVARCLKIHIDKFDNLYGFEAVRDKANRLANIYGSELYFCTEYKSSFIEGSYWTDALSPFKSGKYTESFKPISISYVWDERLNCHLDANKMIDHKDSVRNILSEYSHH